MGVVLHPVQPSRSGQGVRSLHGSSAQPELVGQVPAPRMGSLHLPQGLTYNPHPHPAPPLPPGLGPQPPCVSAPLAGAALGVRPECRPELPRVRHGSPPSLHPCTWKAPQRQCPQTQGGGRCLHTDHPPSCWPATRQHTHSTRMCTPCFEHRVERSCRDPQINILHPPRESWCRGCFSGKAGAGVGACRGRTDPTVNTGAPLH